MDVLKEVGKVFKEIGQVIPGLLKVIPLSVEALIFLVVTVPKFIIDTIKSITKFITKATPLAFAVIISFFAIYFGIQFLFGYLTGMNGVIPAIPLAIISLYVIYDLVLNNNKQLKVLQDLLFQGFIYIFNNPLIKELIGFNISIDEKDPIKSSEKVIDWFLKNIPQTILTLFILALTLKIFIQKSWSYLTFYSEA